MRARLEDPAAKAKIIGAATAGFRRSLELKPDQRELRREICRKIGKERGGRKPIGLPPGHPIRAKAAATFSARHGLAAWCPTARRKEYRNLRARHGAQAARQLMEQRFAVEREASPIIAGFALAARLATEAYVNDWPMSFVLQLEAVRNGARIVRKFNPRAPAPAIYIGSSASMCAEVAL
ncbi:MAG TPA: hypothetical protein VGD10_08265 [Allosphingosinicella sp.]|uniref:hypothetical protein n=1 Tax=Allosphingosinicella sp. TaxID=2823234 RepID=UPI002EDA2328